MKKSGFIILFLLFFAGAPVYLALLQEVPFNNHWQQAVLLVSLAGFGLMLGLFWLSRLMPHRGVPMKFSSTVRWHKVIGYTAGAIMLVHPVLMIARRFWVEESNPISNLLLMIQSPLMLTGVVAWLLLVLIVVLALIRKTIPVKIFRYMHGVMAILFTGCSTWHVVTVGRHSSPAMSGFWILLASGSAAALLYSYVGEGLNRRASRAHEMTFPKIYPEPSRGRPGGPSLPEQTTLGARHESA